MPFSARSVLLALSTDDRVKRLLTKNGISHGFVTRFVAGETLPDALRAAQTLQKSGIRTAMDFLGENVSTEQEAQEATDAYIHVLNALPTAHLDDGYLSVKLTALGLDLGDTLASSNLNRILEAAHGNAFVCVDMEGSAYTQQTLDLVRAAHRAWPNVGTVLQSSLYRTDDDLKTLIADGIPVRLVKGAYAEPASVAYPEKRHVDMAYVRQMKTLLNAGSVPAIATHDEAIIREAKRCIRENRIANDRFEFQMLMGIRRDLQESLAAEGYPVRAYVPFGRTWYPYFMRRLAERPANVGFILKALVKS